ncbi:MAG TPA: hypothetical protein VKR06_27470, partial [Ktedonosporobacter sp.]|nr:hypothetical protein [Ktedonosporobacter sp.]
EMGGTGGDKERWGRWSQEIFADIFSVLVMGQWAVAAMAELELGQPDTMLKRRSRYPAPVVRLKLLADLADRLGLDGSTRVQAYGLDLRALTQANEEASSDAALISSIIDLALGPLPDLSATLPDLVIFRPEEFLTSEGDWSLVLLQQQDPVLQPDLRAARLITSATLCAWAKIAQLPEEQERARQRKVLAKRALDMILLSREEGTRAAEAADEIGDLGAELAHLLRQVDSTQLKIEE